MKKLYICCDRKEKNKYVDKARTAFEGSLSIVDNWSTADLVYVVGTETSEVESEIALIRANKTKMVRVNENFIVEDIYQKTLYGKIKTNNKTDKEELMK